ncbi:MAG TPA: hypothetical protein VG735_11910 [Caulobacterales bacterium]|jgi:hypothetical protein|nr:hypothetical protein [Caulobacterales bacterium]
MGEAEYDEKLHKLLGVSGPAGESRFNGAAVLIYRLPDKTLKYLPPPQDMTSDQRAETIAELAQQLAVIAANRSKDQK